MIQIIPKTKFPTKPINRWTNWTGLLFANDEKYIFTESVCKYLFYNSKYRNIFEEDIDAGEIITILYKKFKKICADPDEKMRMIRVSIRGRVLYFFKKYIDRFFQRKTKREKAEDTKVRLLYQSIKNKEEVHFFWNREFERVFYQALDSLPKIEREIIIQKITGKDLSKIARALEIERHVVEKKFSNAVHSINAFCKAHGLDIYRR